MIKISLKSAIITVILSLVLFGCGGKRAAIKDYYMLDVERQTPRVSEIVHNMVIVVDKFETAEAFATPSLIYRNEDGLYEPDFYRRFIADKGALTADITAQWLRESGLFETVAPSRTGISGKYRLRGLINKMYADMQDAENAQAILKISVFLIDRAGNPVFSGQYKTAAPIKEPTAVSVVEAKNLCLIKYLKALEKDLATANLP